MSKGFTLIELMIVVAIIGILAAVALPAYQDYLARAQVSEAIYLLQSGKQPLGEYYADVGVWPTSASDAMGTVAGKYVSQVTITAGASSTAGTMTITARMKDVGISTLISGRNAHLTTGDGGRTWLCSSPTIDARYLPSTCR